MKTEVRAGHPSGHELRNTKDCHQPPEAGRGKGEFFSGDFVEGAWPSQHLDFGLLASRTETISFRRFKTASLSQFVKATLGH